MGNFFRNIHPLLRRDKRKDQYDDTNFSVLNALNYELTQAEQETIASKIQSSLETATGEYLDTWGDWFGVYRKDGWDDEYYRGRIIRYLLLKRSTIPAIIDALIDFLNDNDAHIEIYEPWKNIFYTNKSKLNGEDHMMGYYYRFAIIDISIDRPFPPEIIEVIKAFKPAGVLFYLRLDMSKNPSTVPVQYPFAFVDVSNKTELELMNGLTYDINGNMNLTDITGDTVDNNIFHTNRSHLNGEDVLAGSFTHGRGYLHLASTLALGEYAPKATDTMSEVKLALGESNPDLYLQTKDSDGRSAQITVPAKNDNKVWSWSADGTDRFTTVYPGENLAKLNTNKEYSWSSEFLRVTDWDLLQLIDKNGLGSYTVTVDLKSEVAGNITIYVQSSETGGGKYDVKTQRVVQATTEWQTFSVKFDFVLQNQTGKLTPMAFFGTYGSGRKPSVKNFKIEKGVNTDPIYTPAPSADFENAYPKYVGTGATTDNPADYTWEPVTQPYSYTGTKTYATFDVQAFIANNYAKEFELLSNDLGEEQALNTLFNTFSISTSLKALVTPSDSLDTKIQLYDFQTNDWHDLTTAKLNLNQQTFNLSVNQITSYLNEHKLLFIRYVFTGKEDKAVAVELDMLNILFHYRMGEGYSLGLQSTVESWQDIPATSITLDSTEVEIPIKGTKQLTATILPESATAKLVEWTVEDPTVATVTEGLITGVGAGTTTLTAYADNRGVQTECTITVYQPVTDITTPTSIDLLV